MPFRCYQWYTQNSVKTEPRHLLPYLLRNKYHHVNVWNVQVRAPAMMLLTQVKLKQQLSTVQSCKQQMTGMNWWYRSAQCRHPLPTLTDNHTMDSPSSSASRQTLILFIHGAHRKPYSNMSYIPSVFLITRKVAWYIILVVCVCMPQWRSLRAQDRHDILRN